MLNFNLFGFAGVSETALDLLFIILFLLATVTVIAIAIHLLTRFIYAPQDGAQKEGAKAFNYKGVFFALLAIGFVVRLIFTFLVKGARVEFDLITGLMSRVNSGGLGSYYPYEGVSTYPVVVYIYSIIGAVAKIFSVTASSVAMPFFVKFPLIICDLLTAFTVYRAAKKYINNSVALILSGLVCLFPPFIFASSVWGSVYSVLALMLVLCFYCAAKKNYPAVIGFYSLALLTGKDALFLFPVVAVFIIYNYVKDCIFLSKNRQPGLSAIIKNPATRNVVLVPASIILSVTLMYFFCLPLMINVDANFFHWFATFFITPIANFKSFGHNALNIFNLFGHNGTAVGADFPAAVFGVLFAIIITALSALIYFSRKNRANLIFLAAFVLLSLSIFYMGFSENTLLPIIILMLFSFILIKDRRILQITGLLSFAYLLNASVVMAAAGHLNNLTDFDLSSSLYTGVTLLKEGGWLALSIICSAIVLITYLYTIMVLLDLSMTSKRKLFKEIEKPDFVQSIKNWIV